MARYNAPELHRHSSTETPASPPDPFTFWSSGTPCPRCGNVFVVDISKIRRLLQPIPCTSCNKNTNVFALFAAISIVAYFGALVLLLLFFPETARSPAMDGIAPLGFFCVFGHLWALGALVKSKTRKKVLSRINELTAELERTPEDMETLGKVFSLCCSQGHHEHAVRIAEYASLLDPENLDIKNQVKAYCSTLGKQGLIPTTRRAVDSTPSTTPTAPATAPQTPFFSPAEKQIIVRIEAWQRKGRSMQHLGIVIVAVAIILGFLSMMITFLMDLHPLWGWAPALAIAFWGFRMSRKPITPLPPGVIPPLGYTVPDPKIER